MGRSILIGAMMAHLALAGPAAAAGPEESAPPALGRPPLPAPSTSLGDPCLFFRDQLSERGLRAFAYDMLLLCEEIARRRAARIRLSDRLEASDGTLKAYREAVVTAVAERRDRARREPASPWRSVTSADKVAIADSTGALMVLEAMREGF